MAFGKTAFRSSHCTRKRSAYFSIHTGVREGAVTSAAELMKMIFVPSSFFAKNTVGTVTPAPVDWCADLAEEMLELYKEQVNG